jgi:hypothetical protein
VRRQVEDVVLHDPRRHDEHRLGLHLRRDGVVLDQLDQVVAVHDATGGDGHLVPGAVGPLGRLQRRQALLLAPGVHGVHGAVHQVGAAAFARALQHLGAERPQVRRRQHVQPLAREEPGHVLVVRRHAAQLRGVAPPVFGRVVGMHHRCPGPLVPHGGGKTGVVAIGGDPAQRFAPPSQRTFLRPHRQPRGLRGLGGQVQRPVGIGQRQGDG